MTGIVSRRDLDFLLFECLDIGQLFATERYADLDRPTVEGLFDMAQAIAEREYLPCAATLDVNEPKFVAGKVEIVPEAKRALTAYANAGLFGASIDKEFGGAQLPYVVAMAINGMFTAANLGLANYSFMTIANANLIAAFGSEEQKRTFLPPMLKGSWFGTMCLSETQAGSSLSDIATRAEPRGDGSFRITGTKMWISCGDHELAENIVHLVLARTEGGAPGVKGLSLYIVPKYRVEPDGSLGPRNGIALAGLNHKMGHRGTTNCLLNFGEEGETVGFLVGEPCKGLSYMFQMMNEARIGVGHASVMSALAGFLYSLDYARTRAQGRHPQHKSPNAPQIPIIEHADVRRMLLLQKAAVEGGLALSSFCALLIDRQKASDDPKIRDEAGLLLDLLTPIAKSWPSEHCLEANKWAIQVLGGYGYTRDYPVERFYRDNRLNHIHEGTFGIQALDLLGRKVRKRDGAALAILTEQIGETIESANASGLCEEATALALALDALLAVTQVLTSSDDLNRALANATLYLDAFGTVVVAWLWLRQAVAAHHGLERNSADAAFYQGKLGACRYFFRYNLPAVHSCFALLRNLDDTCLLFGPKQYLGT